MEKTLCVNEKQYNLLKLLGKGKGGYSYLAESGDYRHLQKIGIPMPKMLDVDIEKERILKEYIEGDTVYELVLQDRMLPEYLEQMKKMCIGPGHRNLWSMQRVTEESFR